MGFAGMEGFGQGLDQGTQIMARLQAMRQQQEQQRQQMAARQAVGNAYMAPQQGAPQPPMPGVASQPTEMGVAPQLPSPDPTEMGAAPQLPPPAAAMIPNGGAPPLPPPMEPMPLPMGAGAAPVAEAQPAAQPPPMGAGGDPLPTQGNDAVRGAQETIRSIAQQIKGANPGITPEALFDATGLQIEQMKGVRNDVKDYMQQQVELAKLQTRMQVTEAQIAGRKDVADINADARVGAAQVGADSRIKVSENQAGARVESARIAALSRMSVGEMAATARVTTAQLGADSREAVAATNADVDRYASDQRYRAAVNAAAVEQAGASILGKGLVAPTSRQPKTYLGRDGKPVPQPKAATRLTPEQAFKLPPGTKYTGADGVERIRN